MAKVKVTAPVAGYSGRIGADVFVDGVAEVEESGLDYYRRHGYIVGDETSEQVEVPSAERDANEAEVIGDNVRPAPGARKADWVAYAESLGIDAVGKTKEDLMEECAEHPADGRNVEDLEEA